jgi:phage baseplate assembly protein V
LTVRPLDTFRALLRPVARRVALLASRGVVRLSDDAHKLQELQVGLLKGETRGPLERFGEFGWTSRPPVGSEVVALFFGGSRDHGVVVAVEDRNTRPQGLQEGEALAYNAFGVRILLKADGAIEITAPGGVKIEAPELRLSGSLTVDGSITAGGDVSDAAGSMAEIRQTFNDHTHPGVQTGSGSTGPPVPPMT